MRDYSVEQLREMASIIEVDYSDTNEDAHFDTDGLKQHLEDIFSGHYDIKYWQAVRLYKYIMSF